MVLCVRESRMLEEQYLSLCLRLNGWGVICGLSTIDRIACCRGDVTESVFVGFGSDRSENGYCSTFEFNELFEAYHRLRDLLRHTFKRKGDSSTANICARRCVIIFNDRLARKEPLSGHRILKSRITIIQRQRSRHLQSMQTSVEKKESSREVRKKIG